MIPKLTRIVVLCLCAILFALMATKASVFAYKETQSIQQLVPDAPSAAKFVSLPIVMSSNPILPPPPITGSDEWTQEAHDAQRTGYTATEPVEPWTLVWTWNGPDANGGTGNHIYDAPREARTVSGGNYIYVPAGANGLYALSKTNGQQGWRITATTFNATPAYDPSTAYLYAGGTDGKLYKINASSGAVAQTYSAGSPLNRSVLLAGSYAYVVTDSGQLHKVNTANMSQVWAYAAGSNASTALAFSASRDVVIYGTVDLYIHAVNNSNGSRKWRTKPSPNTAGFPNEFRWYWPVVAEQHGIVFLRMQIDHNIGLWGYPTPAHIWPNTNAEARTFLQNNPNQKILFALNLDNGTEKFVPAVGFSGWEDETKNIRTGPMPVIKTLPNGREVAYISFRNGQSTPPDYRWDSHMGEMVLDDTTIPGLVAGDLRFVRMSRQNGYGGNSYVFITDEQGPFSMAGDTVFYSHWAATESVKITDRSNGKGLTYANPIETENHPVVVKRQASCSSKNTVTHWTTCGLTLFGDGRYWDGPGWWTYWNTLEPNSTYAMRPLYTYVSRNLLVIEGNGGDLMVFRHSGSN